MKTSIFTIIAILVSVTSWASEQSDKAKQTILSSLDQPHVLWSRIESGDIRYFQLSKETVIVESLSCEDKDESSSYCVLTPTKEASAEWKVKGLIFGVDSRTQSVTGFALVPTDNQ